MNDEKWLTLRECASRLRISYKTVWRAITSGHLKAYKILGQWRVRERDLQAFIERSTKEGQP